MQKREQDSQLRAEVLRRDKCICQLCMKKHKKRYLQIHHIMMWSVNPYLRFDPGNCISLCYACHKSIRGLEYVYQDYFLGIINGKSKKNK